MLLNLANAALEQAGWPTRVLAGSRTFPTGDNIRNVGLDAERDNSPNQRPVERGKIVHNRPLIRVTKW